jgi:hypothetical protein
VKNWSNGSKVEMDTQILLTQRDSMVILQDHFFSFKGRLTNNEFVEMYRILMLKVKLASHLNITPWQHIRDTDVQLCAF